MVVEVLEGDEERQFWLNSQKTRAQFIADRKKSRGRQSGRGRQKGSWQSIHYFDEFLFQYKYESMQKFILYL